MDINRVISEYDKTPVVVEEHRTTVERCRALYEEKGAPMIHALFPEYEERIAVGVVGEGSECFGYDDQFSRDREYGIGFCLWLTDEDYDEIGAELQEAYRTRVAGVEPSQLDFRRGVMRIQDFYDRTLGEVIDTETPHIREQQWFRLPEHNLATATNGAVFRDDLGQFSQTRKALKEYYPERIWTMRLVNTMHDYSKYAQVNYPRAMARKDYVAAEFCKAKGIEAAIDMAFLLARRYAPYYKWKFRALKEYPGFADLAELLERAAVVPSQQEAWIDYEYDPRYQNKQDRVVMAFEEAAEILVEKLQSQGLAEDDQTFLEYHCAPLAARLSAPDR